MCPSFLPVLYLISQSVVLPPTPSVPFFSASEPNGLLGLGSRPSTDVAAVPTLGCCMKPQVLRGAESFLRDFYYVQLTGHERPLTSAVTAGGCGESHRYYQVRSRRMRMHGRGPCSPELQTCTDKRHAFLGAADRPADGTGVSRSGLVCGRGRPLLPASL